MGAMFGARLAAILGVISERAIDAVEARQLRADVRDREPGSFCCQVDVHLNLGAGELEHLNPWEGHC